MIDARRLPGDDEIFEVIAGRPDVVDSSNVARDEADGPVLASLQAGPFVPPTRDMLLSRFSEEFRDTVHASRLVDALLSPDLVRIFGDVDPAQCTETIDFDLLHEGVMPPEVGFSPKGRYPPEVWEEKLSAWRARGISSPAPGAKCYGFMFMVRNAAGKVRPVASPLGVNAATRRYEPAGGVMPYSLHSEAHRICRRDLAFQADFKEAFTTLRLGDLARILSTFRTPLGPERFHQGWFGWHSFPAVWSEVVLRCVLEPLVAEFGASQDSTNWVDDLLVAVSEADPARLVDIIIFIVRRILEFGGRLNLQKTNFFVRMLVWCGMELNLVEHNFRIDRSRVDSLLSTPSPHDRTSLQHCLGILRHYIWGVRDQRSFSD